MAKRRKLNDADDLEEDKENQQLEKVIRSQTIKELRGPSLATKRPFTPVPPPTTNARANMSGIKSASSKKRSHLQFQQQSVEMKASQDSAKQREEDMKMLFGTPGEFIDEAKGTGQDEFKEFPDQ